jgi:hypothetical protein
MSMKVQVGTDIRDATQEEIAAFEARQAAAAAVAPRLAIFREIAAIEATNPVTHRALREMAIGTFVTFNELIGYINLLEERVAALESASPSPQPEIPPSYGVQLANLLNEQIAALRAQL